MPSKPTIQGRVVNSYRLSAVLSINRNYLCPLVLAKGLEPLLSGLRDQCCANLATQALVREQELNLHLYSKTRARENRHSTLKPIVLPLNYPPRGCDGTRTHTVRFKRPLLFHRATHPYCNIP